MSTITVQKIDNQQQREAALRIREKVFVQEQHVPADAEYDQYESNATHYLAFIDAVPCGTARWRVTDNGVKLERFAVLKEFRNQQVGYHILQQVMQDVKAFHPDKKMYLHAQVAAIPFYARHGFIPVGTLFNECNIEHYKMEERA